MSRACVGMATTPGDPSRKDAVDCLRTAVDDAIGSSTVPVSHWTVLGRPRFYHLNDAEAPAAEDMRRLLEHAARMVRAA